MGTETTFANDEVDEAVRVFAGMVTTSERPSEEGTPSKIFVPRRTIFPFVVSPDPVTVIDVPLPPLAGEILSIFGSGVTPSVTTKNASLLLSPLAFFTQN